MSTTKYTQFSLHLKSAREEAGLSKAELARQVGVSSAYIGQLEKMTEGGAKKKPSVPLVERISQVLNVNSVWLIRGEGEKRSSHPPSADSLPETYPGPDRRKSLEIAEGQFCFTRGPTRLTQKENRLLIAFRGLTEQQQEDKLFELEALAERNESRGKLGGGSA